MLALEIAAFWLSGQWISGTVVVTPVINKANYKSWLISADDSDTLIVIPHGFVSKTGAPVAPDQAFVQDRVSDTPAAAGNWGVTIDAVNITLSKTSSAGSGGTPAIKLWAMRPHSIIQ
jgi:hypothetical protein